jgi:hypothetical protein
MTQLRRATPTLSRGGGLRADVVCFGTLWNIPDASEYGPSMDVPSRMSIFFLGCDSSSRTESAVMSENGEFVIEGDHRANNRYQEWQAPPFLTMFSCWELQKFALISKAHEKMVYSQACYLYFFDENDWQIDVFRYLYKYKSQELIHLVFFGDHLLNVILRLCFGGHPRIYTHVPGEYIQKNLRVSVKQTGCHRTVLCS